MQVFTFLADCFLRVIQATRTRVRGLAAFFCLSGLLSFSAFGDTWAPLNKDGVHDPRSPAAKILQQPKEALSGLTPDATGNQVRWVQALEKGEIKPRERLNPSMPIRKLDKDIILDLNGSMPAVRFPHRQHTEWLDCVNCHDKIFKEETGKTNISMFRILQGEQCGICHGAVAFPLTECMRCHSIPKPGGGPSPWLFEKAPTPSRKEP